MSQELDAIKALGEIVEKTNAKSGADLEKLSGEFKERYEAIDKDLQAAETKNQKITTELETERKAREEQEDRLRSLEAKLARAPKGEDQKEVSVAMKAMEAFASHGIEALDADQRKTLNTMVAPEGGVLVPVEMDSQLIKDITEVSPMRAISMVRQSQSGDYEFCRRTSNLAAAWAGELQDRGVTESVYGKETLKTKALTAVVPISTKLLASAGFNMEQEINSDAAEQFAAAEGAAFVNGDGIEKPTGFLQDGRIDGITSGTNDTLTGDDLINVAGELKTGYNPVYVINRRELAFIKTLKGSNGQYLWGNGLAAGLPNTINGYRYIEAIDMPDIADGSKPVAFGDFMKGYAIIDQMGMTAIRDPYSRKKEGIVEFSFERFVDGKVIQPEAIKIITIQ